MIGYSLRHVRLGGTSEAIAGTTSTAASPSLSSNVLYMLKHDNVEMAASLKRCEEEIFALRVKSVFIHGRMGIPNTYYH